MNKIYNDYLQDDTKIKIIDENAFTKIIYKDVLPVKEGMVEIVVPIDTFGHSNSKKIIDEKGHEFLLKGPATMAFRNELPQWYRETAAYIVDGISDINAIGDYIRVVL